MGCRTAAVLVETERAQWATWRVALNKWVSYYDDGYPLRSSGDPRRFEAQVFDRYGGGDGDAAQRAALELAPVSIAFERAIDNPLLSIDPVTAASLFLGFGCGKPITYQAPGRKHVSILRTEWPMNQLAEHHRLGVSEARNAAILIAKLFEQYLWVKGLIQAQQDWSAGAKESDDDMVDKTKTAIGWKEIADAIGLSVATAIEAKTWHPPIPVYNVNRGVRADIAELNAWLRSSPRKQPLQ